MRIRGWIWTAAFLYLVLAIVGCAPAAAPAAPAEVAPSPTAAPATPTPSQERAMRRLTPEEAIVEARRVVAERAGTSVEQVQVLSTGKEEMPIDDLGCAPASRREGIQRPGIVFGEVIVLQANGREYEFRSDGRRLILCRVGEKTMGEQIWPRPISGGQDEGGRAVDQEDVLVAQAVADLAERLQVAKDAIRVRSVEAVEWPDTSLGCPEPGMMYAQVITPGYRIVLEVEGTPHEYHASRTRVIYCPR